MNTSEHLGKLIANLPPSMSPGDDVIYWVDCEGHNNDFHSLSSAQDFIRKMVREIGADPAKLETTIEVPIHVHMTAAEMLEHKG